MLRFRRPGTCSRCVTCHESTRVEAGCGAVRAVRAPERPAVYFLRKRSSRTTSAPSARVIGLGGAVRRRLRRLASRRVWLRPAGLGATGAVLWTSAGVVRRGRRRATGGRSPPRPLGLRFDRELQAELHRRIEEALDGGERDEQPLRNAVERQADLEGVLGDRQVPELVLEDDRHLLRILRAQPRRDRARPAARVSKVT